ncbi:MAG: hypothetical protein PHP37_02990 [Patescibacteria group bacterium]|nr:hypothetical protein [Patescibacteria group bacterium]
MEENNLDVKKMDKNRKTAIIVLSVFSALIIVMGVLNFRHSLNSPLAFKGDVTASANKNSQNCADGNCSVGDLDSSNLELKLIDTDSDSISDWDELFIYSTSPYLEDSDSDGLVDYEEIFTYKTNPNCPEGEDCSGSLTQTESQNVSGTNADDFATLLTEWDSQYDSELSADQLPADLQPEKVSAEYIRGILLEGGFAKEDLDKITDDDLMEVYNEVLADF